MTNMHKPAGLYCGFEPVQSQPGIPNLEPHCGSWVVSRSSTGDVVGEFYNRRNVERFNTPGFIIETAAAYLGRINA